MDKTTGYSLWLMPSGVAFDQLSQIIRTIGRAHRAPVFAPHVTFLGGLPKKESIIIARTEKLCAMLQPYTIRLRGIEYGEEYFRCLYYRVEKTTELDRGYARACNIFEVSPEQFVPHVSLMYGDISRALKEKALTAIQPPTNAFTVEHLDLVLTNGVVEAWRTVRRFAL